MKLLFAKYNERGITSIADRGASVPALKLYRSLRDRGELTVRINATRILSPPFGDRSAIVAKLNELAGYENPGEPNGPSGVGDHWVRIGPLKVFLDGGMLNGTAYMREPWGVGETYQITEPDYRGLLFIEPATLATIAQEAARRGWQMTAHCAGEAGMDQLLAAYLRADQTVGIRHRRWLITHANFTSRANLKLCAELGVAADLQPAWLWKDTRTLLKVLDRADGVVSPVSQMAGRRNHDRRRQRPHDPAGLDPLHESLGPLARHLGRRDPADRGAGVFNPDQRLTRAEALRLYTLGNARLHFEEREKGSIEPGKARRYDSRRSRPAHLPRRPPCRHAHALDNGGRTSRFPCTLRARRLAKARRGNRPDEQRTRSSPGPGV